MTPKNFAYAAVAMTAVAVISAHAETTPAVEPEVSADASVNTLDWVRADYEDPFGEFTEPTAILQIEGVPTLKVVCSGKRMKNFSLQLDNSGENVHIEPQGTWSALADAASGTQSHERMNVKYAFGGEKPKSFGMVLSKDGTEFIAAQARGYTYSGVAQKFARAVMAYDSLILAISVEGTDRAARYDLTGDTAAMVEVMEICKRKTYGSTAGKKKISKP